jgi:hypothetical protein
MKLVTKYQIPVINSFWEKCDEKCAYMLNVYKSQQCKEGKQDMYTLLYFIEFCIIFLAVHEVCEYWWHSYSLQNMKIRKYFSWNIHTVSISLLKTLHLFQHDTFFSIYWYLSYQYILVLSFSMWPIYFYKSSQDK